MKEKDCQLIELYSLLGKKWTVPLFHNIESHPISFNKLRKISKGKISSILLSNRLKEMVKFKLITKNKINEKISYSVTEEGLKFKKIMHELKNWSIESNYELPRVCKNNKCFCDKIFEN